MNEHLLELTHTSYCDGLVVALTALHEARLDNYSRGRERKQLLTENLIVPAALPLTSATFSILSVSLHLLFISVPLSTSVFLFASCSVSLSLHLVRLWIYHQGLPFGSSSSSSAALLSSPSVSFSSWPPFLSITVSFCSVSVSNPILLYLARTSALLFLPLARHLPSEVWVGRELWRESLEERGVKKTGGQAFHRGETDTVKTKTHMRQL